MVLLKLRSVLRTSLVLAQIGLLCLICQTGATKDEEQEIYMNYRPLAMAESGQLVKGPAGESKSPSTTREDYLSSGVVPQLISPDVPSNQRFVDDLPSTGSMDSNLPDKYPDELMPIEIDDLKPGMRISDTLLRIPEKETTSKLTKILTGPEEATLVGRKLVKPVIRPMGADNSQGKVLATYKILVPIFIPAVKAPRKIKMPPPKVQFKTEKHVQMIQVKKNVPRVKTIYKAERVPQQVITDFVKADGTTVPSNADDKLRPDEQVLKSVVTNYD